MLPTWDPTKALAGIEPIRFSGNVWRGHRQIYAAQSDQGSRLSSGRYHQGPDCFPQGPIWPALYLALLPETAVLEIVRQYSRRWPPKNYRFSELHLDLEAVLDVRDPSMLGLTVESLCDDAVDSNDPCFMRAWRIPRALAQASVERGLEGIIVPSASRRGDNIIVFPDNLHPRSTVQASGEFFDPRFSREIP